MSSAAALGELLQRLRALDYRFVAVTPATHARVVARPLRGQPTIRDIFGWNRPFGERDLDASLLALLEQGGALCSRAEGLRSAVRVASLGGDLFLHSGFPTERNDAVFFGPDTYRFARFIRQRIPQLGSRRQIADMGAGSGAGAVVAARVVPDARVIMVDVNPAALQLARINAEFAGVRAVAIQSDRIPERAELIVANPPYMIDTAGRAYRDGGRLFGGEVALDWARQALASLSAGGAMLLYTGAAVIDGRAPLLDALARECTDAGASLAVEEIDPDVFGEELETPAYSRMDRIAAVGVLISRGE